jgi:integral membrane sensor domain MASE1
MFYFALEVIGVSILVSLFATWIKLVPKYPKRKYNLLQQALNTVIVSLLLTILFSLQIYPSWAILFAAILFVLWASVKITDTIVSKRNEPSLNAENKSDPAI